MPEIEWKLKIHNFDVIMRRYYYLRIFLVLFTIAVLSEFTYKLYFKRCLKDVNHNNGLRSSDQAFDKGIGLCKRVMSRMNDPSIYKDQNMDCLKWISELEKENEKLKKIEKGQQKQIKELYEKIYILHISLQTLKIQLLKAKNHQNYDHEHTEFKINDDHGNKAQDNFVYLSIDNKYMYESTKCEMQPAKKFLKGKNDDRKKDMISALQIATQKLKFLKTATTKAVFSLTQGILTMNLIEGVKYAFFFKEAPSNKVYKISISKPFLPYITSTYTEQTNKLSQMISIIVAVSSSTDRLKKFLEMLEKIVRHGKEKLFITFILHGHNSSLYQTIKRKVNIFKAKTNFKNVSIVYKDTDFRLGRARHDGAINWKGEKNILLFFCDVDVSITPAFLSRCRLNAELGKTVYYPIVFSLYNPKLIRLTTSTVKKPESLQISIRRGTWRPLGYGMVCVYRPDYLNVGGFNVNFKDWGDEDIDLYQRFLNSSISIIRTPDPGIFHRWHPKHCDMKLLGPRRYKQCLGSKTKHEASHNQLGSIIFSKNFTW